MLLSYKGSDYALAQFSQPSCTVQLSCQYEWNQSGTIVNELILEKVVHLSHSICYCFSTLELLFYSTICFHSTGNLIELMWNELKEISVITIIADRTAFHQAVRLSWIYLLHWSSFGILSFLLLLPVSPKTLSNFTRCTSNEAKSTSLHHSSSALIAKIAIR